MKIATIFLGILFLWLLNGCYEDKGNYNYTDVREVKVDIKPENSYTIFAYLGEEVEVEPKLTFEYSTDTLDYEYTWKLDTTTISHDRVLKYTHQGVCKSFTLYLYVTDIRSGQVYFNSTALQVDSPYKYGYLILAEKRDGSTDLHYLRLEKPNDKPYYYTPFLNLYSSLFANDPLGKRPYFIAENYTIDNRGGDELLIFQQEGGCISLDGRLFNKVVSLDEEFYGGYPAGVTPQYMVFGNVVDLMVGNDGNVYTRYIHPQSTQGNGFHLTRFLNLPFDFDKKNTYIDQVFQVPYFWSGLQLMHDKTNNRFVAFATNTDAAAGKQGVIDDNSSDYEKFINLNNFGEFSLVWATCEATAYGSATFRCIFKKDCEYYVQKFTLAKDYNSTTVRVSNQSKWKFDASDIVSEQTVYAMLGNGNFMYFAEGKSLYYCEFRNEGNRIRQIVKKIHDFDHNVTHLRPDYNGDRLLIALESGKFYIFYTVNEVLGSENPWTTGKMYESPDDIEIGEIKQVIFKYGNFSNAGGSGAPW